MPADLRHLVLDEVDILYEDPDFDPIWRTLRAAVPPRAAHTFVTATLPPAVEESILRHFPLARPVKGPGLHQTRAGVRQKLVDCSAGSAPVRPASPSFPHRPSLRRDWPPGAPACALSLFCTKTTDRRR